MEAMSISRDRIWHTTQWGIWMLAISVFLNYVDRGALGIAMPRMKTELTLNAENLGLLASAFFWTYALLQVPAGWLVDRFDVKWVLGIGFAIWTLATGLTGLATSFAGLLGLRLLLGIGESVAYPAYSRIIATRFPPEKRGMPNALIDAFSKMGPALSTLLGGLMVAQFGWRFLFIAMGLGGLVWLLPWLIWRSKEQHDTPQVVEASIGFLTILSKRECWGTFFGLFALNYAWYFLIFWFPSYLVDQRHYSQERMAVMGSVPFWLLGASSMITGWLSDRLISKGHSATLIRKSFMCGGLYGVAVLMLFATHPDPTVALGVVMLAGISMGFASSNNWAITQTLAGRPAAGRWTGLQNGFGNMAGAVGTWLTGFVINKTDSYVVPFAVTAGILVVGTTIYLLLIPRVAPINWGAQQPEAATGQGAD